MQHSEFDSRGNWRGMNFHSLYSGIDRPVETCVVGSGAFGQSFLGQATRVRLLRARIAVDRSAEIAAQAFRVAGIEPARIRICTSAAEARRAFDQDCHVAAESIDAVLDLPFELLIEATGHP